MTTMTRKPNYYTYSPKGMHIPCVCINSKAPFLFDIRKVHNDFGESDNALSSFHTHKFFSITLFLKGAGSHIVDNNKYAIEPDTLVLMSPNRSHKHTVSIGLTYYVITFSYNFLNQFDDSLKKYIICNLFGQPKNITLNKIKVDYIVKFKNILDLAMAEIDKYQHDLWQATFIKSIMATFFILLERYFEESSNKEDVTNNTYNEILFNFENMVDKKFRSTHYVCNYAKELNLSVGTLNKYITKNTGMTASDIIDNRIIHEAQKLLTFSKYNITEISLLLGFSEPSNFTKFFKKRIGITPSEFKDSSF